MTAASFRITLWQAKKPYQRVTRPVTAVDAEEAVSLAQEWIQWSNDKERGKKPKFDHYRVEALGMDKIWRGCAEGTLEDAKTQRPEKHAVETENRALPTQLIGFQGAARIGNRRKTATQGRPQTRLALMVTKVRSGK